MGEGWALFRRSASSLIVATIIYFVIYMAANMIPFLNLFAGFLLPGAMLGGMYYIILDAAQGAEFDIKRLFDGFRLKFMDLTLVYILISIFTLIAVSVPMIIGAVYAWMTAGPIQNLDDPARLAGFFTSLAVFAIPAAVIGILVYSWYMFSYLFVVERGYGFWEAMEASREIGFQNHFKVFLFIVVLWLVNVAGALFFGVGLLISFPYSMCAVAAGYTSLAGAAPASPREKTSAPPPPPPVPAEPPRHPAAQGPRAEARLSGCVHVFVFIEGQAPEEREMMNIVRAGAPFALDQERRPIMTGQGVETWPANDAELKTLIKQAMEKYRKNNPGAPPYTDSARFKIKVWKGRDSATGTNMALASVLVK